MPHVAAMLAHGGFGTTLLSLSAGVPMVLVYPKNANEPPMVFDVVTSGIILDALTRAAH